MKTFECDTCKGDGEILAMVPGGTGMPVEDMIECPDCDGVGLIFAEPKHPHIARIRRGWSILVDDLAGAWRSWQRGGADVVAARITVARDAMLDERQMRLIVEHRLRDGIAGARSLGWMRADLGWSLRNAWRALTGREMRPVPYEVALTISIIDDPDALVRRQYTVVAEERRVPRRG